MSDPALLPETPARLERHHASEAAYGLTVQLMDDCVVSAVFQGAVLPGEKQLLDAMAAVMTGVPIREAADHAAIYALQRAESPMAPPGIRLPCNTLPLLTLAERLVRRIHAEYCQRHGAPEGWNGFDRGVSSSWKAQSRETKTLRIQASLDRFLAGRGLAEPALVITAIDSLERIYLQFGPELHVREKPSLLMAFEHCLRRETGERLEVFLTEMKDQNGIRRL